MTFDKSKLKPDCAACDALCCIAPKFEAPNYHKPVAVPCRNLKTPSLKCEIYDSREALGFIFCLNFDCHGAGQAVTKLFQNIGCNWQTDESKAKVEFDVFVHVYCYLSYRFYPDQPVQVEADQESADKLKPFINAALCILSERDDGHP